MPHPPRLESERLILDTFRPDDVEALFAYASNPAVARWMAWEPHRDIEESRRVLGILTSPAPDRCEWAVRLRERDGLVGGFTFVLQNETTGEIHFTIAESHWGRGLATEAGRMILDWAWTAHSSLGVIATAPAAENVASLKVLERLGFAAGGRRRAGFQKFPQGVEVIEYRLARPVPATAAEGQVSAVTLRPANADDLPFLENLRRTTMRRVVENHRSWNNAEQRQRILHHFDCAQIIVRDGRAIGLWKVIRNASEFELCQIQIDPAHQGQGIGTRLIQELQTEAHRLGLPITLHVYRSNPALALYRRLGFETASEDSESLRMTCRPRQGPVAPG